MIRIRTLAALLAAILALAHLSGCASGGPPVAVPRDESLATSLADLQTRHARFFDQLQRTAGTAESEWPWHVGWYEQTRADIAAIRLRAAAGGARNAATLRALELLETSLFDLEKAHAGHLPTRQLLLLRSLFDAQLRMLLELESRPRERADEGPPAGRRGRQRWLPQAGRTHVARIAICGTTSAAGRAGPPEASRRSLVREPSARTS